MVASVWIWRFLKCMRNVSECELHVCDCYSACKRLLQATLLPLWTTSRRNLSPLLPLQPWHNSCQLPVIARWGNNPNVGDAARLAPQCSLNGLRQLY